VTTDAFSLIGCVSAGDTEVVLAFPALDCHSAAYARRRSVIYFLLVMWVAALPIGLFLFLRYLRQADKLANARTLHRWGFLYSTYRPEYYWLEPLYLMRRAVIVSLSVLLLDDSHVRSTALVTVMWLCGLLQVYLRPYAHKPANYWEIVVLAVLSVLASLISGHSVVQDGPYTIGVQVLSSLLVAALGLALVGAVLYGKVAGCRDWFRSNSATRSVDSANADNGAEPLADWRRSLKQRLLRDAPAADDERVDIVPGDLDSKHIALSADRLASMNSEPSDFDVRTAETELARA